MLIHALWPKDLGALGKWLYFFSTSAGLGGVAALGAASIAYIGVMRSAQTARVTSLTAQWWENARWASDRLLSVADEDRNQEAEDISEALLSDRDAYTAIATLHHLGESAPDDTTAAFIQRVLGMVLGLDSEDDPDADLDDQDEEDDDDD